MYVRVLGPVSAESGGHDVAISVNQRLLVALLAAHAGRIVPADVLTDALWPDEQPRKPTAALQNLVSRIRARLAPTDLDLLVTRPPGYGLVLDAGSVDRLEFEARLNDARTETDPRRALDGYAAALELWRGHPYAEFAHVPTLRADAVWLDELHTVAREERLVALTRLDPAAAVAELEAVVVATPFRERPHALLMEALHRTGRRRDALGAYTAYRTMLAEQLGLDPSPTMQALEHAVLDDTLANAVGGTVGDAPTRVPAAAQPGNLPVRRTSFVGRAAEIDAVGCHVHHHRLVTLVGAGGSGKTSLAVEVARSVGGRFADGAWVVDLLQLTSGSRIAEHVAATIGLGTLPLDDLTASLVTRLRDRRLLIVLDNCEHVIDDAAALADALLDGDDGTRILSTSREPLRVRGEVVSRVEPLGVPSEAASLADVLASASGRLLVDRIGAADTALRLTDADAAAISAICRRLDGLPLALELAAARVPSLGLQQVAERLGDRFSLLTSNHRGGIAHHQTLRAAIAWSVDLLDDQQRLLLARLSVFAGGFDLDATEAVCADDRLQVRRVPEALATLVERSLVVTNRPDGAGAADTVRYQLLETVREYAAELLDGEPGEAEAVVRRHRRWSAALAAAIGDGFLVDTDTWYRRLRVDFANLGAAFHRALDHGDVADALDLVASLRWAPFNTGHLYGEHRAWIEAALAHAREGAIDDPALMARGLVAAGAVAGLETRSAEALALLNEALASLHGSGTGEEAVWCRMWLGAFAADLGRFDEAVEHTRVGLGLAESIGDPAGVVYLANQHAENAMAGALLLPAPDYLLVARDTYAIALREAGRHGIDEGLVRAEHGMALLTALDDPSAGLDLCERALSGWRRLGYGNRLIVGLICSARVAVLAGESSTTAALTGEAIEAIAMVGYRQPLGRAVETAAVHALDTGDTTSAALLAGAAGCRFLTPRWFVSIGAEQRFAHARDADPDWEVGLAAGASMTDDAVMALVRQVCQVAARAATGVRHEGP